VWCSNATTKVNIGRVNARYIHDREVLDDRTGVGTYIPLMTKMDREAKLL
jgi:hypothetical protein